MIVAGGVLVALGHVLLTTHATFLLALVLVILGTGGLKGNIAAQVADLYAPQDGRRERGFSLFYVGINTGATAAPLVCAWLAQVWGWSAAFEATSVGMLVGLAIYVACLRLLPGARGRQAPAASVADQVEAGRGEAKAGRRAAWAVLGLISLASVFMWMSYEQQANAMMRWLVATPDDVMMAWIQAIPPGVVLLGTPLLNRWWSHQARRGREPGPVTKLLIGAGFVVAAQLLLPVYALVSGASPGHGAAAGLFPDLGNGRPVLQPGGHGPLFAPRARGQGRHDDGHVVPHGLPRQYRERLDRGPVGPVLAGGLLDDDRRALGRLHHHHRTGRADLAPHHRPHPRAGGMSRC
jgi:dipeptide/tripeptide permease